MTTDYYQQNPNYQAEKSADRQHNTAPIPTFRRLRVYAFDPSLSGRLDTSFINELTLNVDWEGSDTDGLEPGPCGEYLEVIDYDPSSNCFYEPVDLNDRYLLAQDGLAPAEGNPQFHQQMVYAVAMTTIHNFERALGRRILWAPHRVMDQTGDVTDEVYVPRLRIYPHALRMANAYYSPGKKALLFGYFPADPANSTLLLPGGTVFTCLSHDIIAHETTHALLDGMHQRFLEPVHPDNLAFHEAFADIIALFQHFTFSAVLRHQIARTRGDLTSQSLLGQLAQEFGIAIGNYGALRDAIGGVDPSTGQWTLKKPDPRQYREEMEPHARGAILVSAIFEAFLTIYQMRVKDLARIASQGTGILPEGELHPDLVNRMAAEASKAADHVLSICIRALDYCPPNELSFGDYLRGLITADYDLVPNDDLGYRVAFIEAFKRRGIYPSDVPSLSVESLRWKRPFELAAMVLGKTEPRTNFRRMLEEFRTVSNEFTWVKNRRELYDWQTKGKRILHNLIRKHLQRDEWFQQVAGLVLDPDHAGQASFLRLNQQGEPLFEVHSLQRALRVGPDRSLLDQLVVQVTQTREVPSPRTGQVLKFRGGATLILDLRDLTLKYAIKRRISNDERLLRQQALVEDTWRQSLRGVYFEPEQGEPFAALHQTKQW